MFDLKAVFVLFLCLSVAFVAVSRHCDFIVAATAFFFNAVKYCYLCY